MPQFTFTNRLMEKALRKAFLDGVMEIYESSHEPRIYSITLEGSLSLLINKSEKYYIKIQETAERAKNVEQSLITKPILENVPQIVSYSVRNQSVSNSSNDSSSNMLTSPLDSHSDIAGIEPEEETYSTYASNTTSLSIPTTRTPMITYTAKVQQRAPSKSSMSTSTTDSTTTMVTPIITEVKSLNEKLKNSEKPMESRNVEVSASASMRVDGVGEGEDNMDDDVLVVHPDWTEIPKSSGVKREREEVNKNGHTSKKIRTNACGSINDDIPSPKSLNERFHFHRNVVECPLCNEPISNQTFLLLHLDRHRKEFVEECPVCKQGGQPLDVLLFHLTNFHLTTPSAKPPHLHLATTSGNDSRLRIDPSKMVQLMLDHENEKSSTTGGKDEEKKGEDDGEFQIEYVCDLCGDSFNSGNDLNIHNKSVHGDDASEDFRCCECNVKFQNMFLFQDHMLDHHKEEEKYKCETCGEEFVKSEKLKEHIKLAHTISYNCSHCKKLFKDNKSLIEHEKTHALFVCDLCDAPFTSTRAYNAHRRSHVDAKPHVCHICQSTFLKKGDMAKHMRTIHEPKKLYMCKVCGRTGTRSDNMRVHVRTHKKGYSREMVDSLLQRVDQ
ncbi:hypothetical protein SNE40_007967 [Patella caerulea]|uniref:C2H2-type domain-containing protein n=1 Tax=Patella caerulea TaxID=87958 RepID=A0AAN8PY62_PATCE